MKRVVIHPGGWAPKKGDLGPHTIARLKAALAVPGKKIFFIPGGGLQEKSGQPICALMRDWLVDQGVNHEDICIPKHPRADNSIADVLEVQIIIGTERVIVVSSWWHIVPRLWVIWRRYGNIEKEFVLAPDRVMPLEFLRELLGTIAVLLGNTGPRWIKEINNQKPLSF